MSQDCFSGISTSAVKREENLNINYDSIIEQYAVKIKKFLSFNYYD